MSLSRDSKAERKWKLIRRAEFRLQQSLARVDFEEDVLLPEIAAIKAGKSVMGLPEGSEFDIRVVHEDRTPRPNPDPKE